jgi:hypothetical protein
MQLKLLDTLVEKIIEALAENSCKVKVSDALKAIQLREKVAKNSEAEQIFWQMIEEIKAEGPPGSHPEFTPLQRQIHSAILPLRDSVKNAILPVKTITESFNSSRSEQAQLTTRRMGKLLTGMGFTMVKASNGSSAIIWDDDLLPPPTPSGPAEPAGAEEAFSSPLARVEDPSRNGKVDEVSEGGGAGQDFSSPLVGEELKERGNSPPEDLIQGIDVLPTNPPTPLPWESTENLSSPTYPQIHPGSPPIELSHPLALSSDGRAGGFSSPPVGEDTGEGDGFFSPARDRTSCSKPAIEKNKNKPQNPLKPLKHQFSASRDPPK